MGLVPFKFVERTSYNLWWCRKQLPLAAMEVDESRYVLSTVDKTMFDRTREEIACPVSTSYIGNLVIFAIAMV